TLNCWIMTNLSCVGRRAQSCAKHPSRNRIGRQWGNAGIRGKHRELAGTRKKSDYATRTSACPHNEPWRACKTAPTKSEPSDGQGDAGGTRASEGEIDFCAAGLVRFWIEGALSET